MVSWQFDVLQMDGAYSLLVHAVSPKFNFIGLKWCHIAQKSREWHKLELLGSIGFLIGPLIVEISARILMMREGYDNTLLHINIIQLINWYYIIIKWLMIKWFIKKLLIDKLLIVELLMIKWLIIKWFIIIFFLL